MLVHKKNLHSCCLFWIFAAYLLAGLFVGSVFPKGGLDHIFDDTWIRFYEEFLRLHISIITENDNNANIYIYKEEVLSVYDFGKNADLLAPRSSPGQGLKTGQDQLYKLWRCCCWQWWWMWLIRCGWRGIYQSTAVWKRLPAVGKCNCKHIFPLLQEILFWYSRVVGMNGGSRESFNWSPNPGLKNE